MKVKGKLQKRRWWVRLHEKGRKVAEIPCHFDQYLEERIAAAGLAANPEVPLFPTLRHGRLADGALSRLPRANVNLMIQRRAKAAQLRTKISAHSLRATGITTYLQNGGKLEVAQAMAGHESARTSGLYDRRDDTLRSMKGTGSPAKSEDADLQTSENGVCQYQSQPGQYADPSFQSTVHQNTFVAPARSADKES